MFNFFKGIEDNTSKDVKAVRNLLLTFVKGELQKAEGGEGSNIRGIHLFFSDAGDKNVYESAVYLDEPDRFKEEIQKIADDFAVDLPANWQLELSFINNFPSESLPIGHLNAALFIRTKDKVLQKTGLASIHVLNGEAEQEIYQISSADGKLNIGREKKAQVTGGFFRHNHIAFSGESANNSNKFISRQHAHIEWSNENGCFMLYADEGGIPPSNKVKIKPAGSDTLIKLNSADIGHRLQEGDQVILGESAVVEFSYQVEVSQS